MESSKDVSCDLSPVESLISRTILDKLEKQISLAKVAYVKTLDQAQNNIALPNSSTHVGKGDLIKLSEENCTLTNDDKISLEAKLEYSKLRKQFSNNKVEVGDETAHSTSSVVHEKFSEDVDFILNIICKSKHTLKEKNSYAVFKEDVLKASIHLNAENQLKADIVQTKERIKTIKEEIRKREIELSLEEQENVGEICLLKDEHFLIMSEGKETLDFTETYFKAQSCNSSSSHRYKVEAETGKIEKINKQIDRDVHCLAVMESWTEDFCKQLEEKINEWKRKLRGDELVMDMRIDAKRRAIKSQEELIKSLNETIAERLEELAPWEEEKEVERLERLAHMRRYYSARKIQRWWRGYMVKLKLYKKRKIKPPKA